MRFPAVGGLFCYRKTNTVVHPSIQRTAEIRGHQLEFSGCHLISSVCATIWIEIRRNPWTGSPNDLHSNLNQARCACRRDSPEVRTVTGVSIWLLKLRVIPCIEKFHPKLRNSALGQARRLRDSKVPVIQTRTVNDGGARVPEEAGRGNREATRIEPIEAVVANVVRKLAVAAVAHTIREMVQEHRVGLVWPR